MPIPGGTAGAHDDAMHQGSAKRDVISGVAGLDSSGNLLVVGSNIFIPRDTSDNVKFRERITNEYMFFFNRVGADDYKGQINVGGVYKEIQQAGHKDVVNGIVALDAGGAVLAPGSEVKLTRDGSENIEVVERASGDIVYRWTRIGANDYECRINCGGVACIMLNDSMKDIANGIAGLDASAELLNSVYAGIDKEYSLSAAVLHSHDTSVNTVSTTYVKLKTITLSTLFQTPATIRISFKLWTSNAAETAYGRIYKNGGAVGTERTRTGSGSETFEEDISFAQGDTLELYLKSSSGSWDANAMEFRVLGAETDLLLADAIAASSIGLADPFVGANS